MSEDEVGVPSENTPTWWLSKEQREKYRGPKTWERNREITVKFKQIPKRLDPPSNVVD